MFYFCCFVLLLILTAFSSCQNTFIATKGNDVLCVTNGSSGLTWNFNFGFNLPHRSYELRSESQYIPTPTQSRNNFDCEITDDYQTKKYYLIKPWTLKNFWNSNTSNEIILDRRWEEMKLNITGPSQEYVLVTEKLGPNFDIPISIRIAREAYIYLCDGADLKRSFCYVFGLKAFGTNTNGIKKCPAVNTSSSCSDLLDKKTSSANLIDKNLWTHFKLTKKHEYTFLTNEVGSTVLQIRHNMSVSHMFVHSRFVTGLWKIHNIDYIYTDKETNDTILGPKIRITDRFACVSMIVSMCETCRLKLKLRSGNVLLEEETYQNQANKKKWFEIKFMYYGEKPRINETDLLVSTIYNKTNKSAIFWAIDKVRLCQNTEFRMIEWSLEVRCQSLEDHTLVYSVNPVATIASNCPTNTIGTFCIPCHWIDRFKNCDKIKVCTQYKLGKTACWCSSGYTNLPDCEDVCSEGNYGLSCNKTCGHCSSHFKCDARSGTCLSSCTKNFVGPQCDRVAVSPPYELQTKWLSNDKLQLKWKFQYTFQSKFSFFCILVYKCKTGCRRSDTVFEQRFYVEGPENNFTYIVNASFQPSTYYTVMVYSNNTYSTRRVALVDLSPPEVPYLYKDAKLTSSDSTITIELELSAGNVTILVSDGSGYLYAHPELESLGSEFRNFTKYRTIIAFGSCNQKCIFVVGDGGLGSKNPPLIPNTPYNITYILSTSYGNKTSYRIYSTTCSTTFTRLELLSLLILLIIPLVVMCLICKKLKGNFFRNLFTRQYDNSSIQGETSMEMKPSTSNTAVQRNNKSTRVKNVNSYLNPVFPSRIISVKDFHHYVKQAEKDGEIVTQFEVISSTKKIYDEVEGNRFFHYIDMIFVNGSVIPKAYLVTDVPKLSETHTFWRNIFEGNVKCIVVLNSRENSKCFQYWPQVNEKLTYDNISIQLFSQQNFLHYELRKFILNHNETKRYIDHINFYYSGRDEKNYIPLFRKLSECSLSSGSPILIHTSDSITRIGFVLLCDMSIRMATEEGVVDVLGNFKRLSDQVAYLVDDWHLYKLSYSLIAEYIFGDELACNLKRLYNNLKSKEF